VNEFSGYAFLAAAGGATSLSSGGSGIGLGADSCWLPQKKSSPGLCRAARNTNMRSSPNLTPNWAARPVARLRTMAAV